MTAALRVYEDGQPIDFNYEAILDYHGRSAPAGVAHALKVMQRAFPLLDPSGRLERREIVVATAFAGPGARDAFEAVTRAVTDDRYTVDPRLAAPERGPTMANFVFHLSYRGGAVHLRLRPGHVSEEFIELAQADDLSAARADRLHQLKLEMSERLRGLDAAEVYEVVADSEPPHGLVDADRAAIASIVRTFFAAFTSAAAGAGRFDALRAVFLPGAVIVRTCGGEPAVYGVESFIAPRRALLAGGTLVDFSEWELAGHTEVFGDIAQHFCSYAKAGVQDGTPFAARGMKTLQFVRTSAGWRISAAAWDDERDGLAIESTYGRRAATRSGNA